MRERYLILQGRVSAKTRRFIRKGLPRLLPFRSRICFVSYVYADLPLPATFDTLFRYNSDEVFVREGQEIIADIFPPERLAAAVFTPVEIVAVTQQVAKSFDYVPHGWKTIWSFAFPRASRHR